ncbi:ribosomal biogenesis regulatory protein [Acephala macrosclerotiorum]|nr:ribosomal biogenesis regulatory protein [Acephala macrosclerotiorum]
MAETESKGPSRLPVVVNKPTPYTFDLGLLLASDPNPLLLTSPENLEDDLAATARDGAQALLNQLLSTCPIASTPNGVLLSLPGIETRLPREKPLPPPKAPTTWEKFAAKKGIKSKTAEERKKMQYDEATGEWVPKWGYKGANKKADEAWIVEVDEKKERERKEGTQVRGDGRRERKEKVRRNERLQRANERKQKKNHGGRRD